MRQWPEMRSAELTEDERADLLACPDWILRILGAKVDTEIDTQTVLHALAYEARIPWYAHHRRAVARLRNKLTQLNPTP